MPTYEIASEDLAAVAQQTKYPLAAFLFLRRGLDFTVSREHGELPEDFFDRPDNADAYHNRHISGRQLCYGLRDFAIQEYGLLARTVLRRWNIRSCEDFGHIVFAMVDNELMHKAESDTFADFQGVFDFTDAFSPELSLAAHI